MHAARVRRRQADGHVERRRLAGAVRPEQADDLARRDLEADAADDRAAAVRLGELVRAERRHQGGRPWLRRTVTAAALRLRANLLVAVDDDPIGRSEEGQRPARRFAALLDDRDRHRRRCRSSRSVRRRRSRSGDRRRDAACRHAASPRCTPRARSTRRLVRRAQHDLDAIARRSPCGPRSCSERRPRRRAQVALRARRVRGAAVRASRCRAAVRRSRVRRRS